MIRYFLVLVSLLTSNDMLNADSSRIAAIVNKGIITKADLQNRIKFAAISSGLEPTAENLEKINRQMLHVMIDEELQRQEGKKYGIEISENHIKAAIKDIEESNGMPESAIAQMMQENQIPFNVIENQMRAQLTWMFFIREKYPLKTLEDQMKKKGQQDYLPYLQIADWEIDQEIKRQEEKETKTQLHLAEIVLPFDGPDQEEGAKNNLNHLIGELEKGAHFSALAQQFSGSATSAQGGDMGWLTEDQLEPEIKEHISHMQPGQLSTPIRTSQGYTIIAFVERKMPNAEGEQLLTLQQVMLPFTPNITEEKAYEVMGKAEEISRAAKSCSELENIAKTKYPSAAARMVQNSPLANFPEPLQKVVTTLTLNQASEPLLTQEGALLLMLCDKKTQEKKEITREDAKDLVASRKHALLARRELRDLRRHAFIDLRM